MRRCVKCREQMEDEATKRQTVCRRCRNGRRRYCQLCQHSTRFHAGSCARCEREKARADLARVKRRKEEQLAALAAEERCRVKASRRVLPATTVPLVVWMAQQEDRIRASGAGFSNSRRTPLGRRGYDAEETG